MTFEPIVTPRPAKAIISFGDVLEAVAQESDIDKRMLLGPRRSRAVSYPRQLVMLVARRRCPWASMVQIGRWLGDRDHTTICGGVKAAEARLRSDADYRRLYIAVNRRLTQMMGAA